MGFGAKAQVPNAIAYIDHYSGFEGGRGERGLHGKTLREKLLPLPLALPLQARPTTGVIGVCIWFISGKGVHGSSGKVFFKATCILWRASGAAKVAALTEFILNF